MKKLPEEYLAQVLALPTEPDFLGDPTAAAPAQSTGEPPHRNKKAYRTEKEAKKAAKRAERETRTTAKPPENA